MKIRFGFTIGPETTPEVLGPLVDDLERHGFDSLWVPEVLLQPTLDPMVALAFAAGRTEKLKLGTHLIIPGRHPVTLARQLAHLDRLSGGRLLLVGVIGLPNEADAGAQGVGRKERAATMEEMVPLLRMLWRGEAVDHEGPRYPLSDVTIKPTPTQQPLEVWLGGKAKGALERCGRLGDGWMPGLMLPAEAAALRPQIEASAKAAGREMDPEHFGANLFYASGPMPPQVAEFFKAQRAGDPADIVPVGFDALRDRVREWTDAGFSKFLLRPLVPPDDMHVELDRLAAEMLPLTT
ncbi:MAG: LLM class flavin-dependent oxidoreductase [Candidatus Binatia bacterium]|nr:LLM class flavin-dependent oxidoreductase [Candidatus Binatia bacterium]